MANPPTVPLTPSPSAPSADWQLASQRAQDRIVRLQHQRAQEASSIPGTISSFFSGTTARPSFRVGQLDTELLDEELLDLLKGQLWNGLKYFRPSIKETYEPELLLLLRAALFKLTIWDNNASYGAALQNLRYTDARKKGPLDHPPSITQKSLYGLITVGGRYLHQRLNLFLLSSSSPDSSTPFATKLSRLLDISTSLHSALTLVSFTAFLVTGHYRTLLDRLLRMRLTTPDRTISREVSFEYLNRQLVWHAFTEFLLFILPLLRVTRWRRYWSRFLRKISSSPLATPETQGELAFLPQRTCAICYKETDAETPGAGLGARATDITNPYEAVECGHVYCYICIAGKIELEEGEGWTCLRCGGVVKRCRPWRGDVVGLTVEENIDEKSEVSEVHTELLDELQDGDTEESEEDEDEEDEDEEEGDGRVGERLGGYERRNSWMPENVAVDDEYESEGSQGTERPVTNGASSGSSSESESEEEEEEEVEVGGQGEQWPIDYTDESLLDDSQYNTAEDYE